MNQHPLPVRLDAASAIDARVARSFRAHRDRIASLLSRSGLGTGDAEDVTQEAFLVLARRIADVPERAERAFLMSTALRLASDRRRSVWHGIMTREWTVDDWGIAGASPDDVYADHDARRRIDMALARLRDDERSAFVLVELEGLSRSEAAHLLDTAPGTIASRLARARHELELALSELPPDAALPAACKAWGEPSADRLVGAQRFLMNPWGQSKTQSRFEQRFVERRHDGRRQHGWYWYWPGLDRTVFAYPEVLIGWKPWSGGATTDTRLPIQVADAQALVVDYAVETRATGSYNLAISTWLSDVHAASSLARPELITTEIMVWPDYSPGATPPGRFMGEAALAGSPYELWLDRQHGSRFRGDRAGWTVLTLRGVGGSVAGQLPFGEMLADLVTRGLVRGDDYVTCVELGNELMGGAGTTFAETFTISF